LPDSTPAPFSISSLVLHPPVTLAMVTTWTLYPCLNNLIKLFSCFSGMLSIVLDTINGPLENKAWSLYLLIGPLRWLGPVIIFAY
jgi:hypothetical protein